MILGADGRPAWDLTTENSPAVRVVLDTTPPVVRLVAKSNGVEWTATDANLDPASVTLQAKFSDTRGWETVTVPKFKASDSYAWPLPPGQVIEGRVSVKDKAGNEGMSAAVRVTRAE